MSGGSVPNRRMEMFYGIRGTDDIVRRRLLSVDAQGNNGGFTHDFYHLTDPQFSTVAVMDASARVLERISYTAYGLAQHHNGADLVYDRVVNIDDLLAVNSNWSQSGEAPKPKVGDITHDGVVNMDDLIQININWGAIAAEGLLTEKWGASSSGGRSTDNEFGYGGYIFNVETMTYTARRREYDPILGRWLSRDPAGYADGMLLYAYVSGNPMVMVDPLGLFGTSACENRGWWGDLWNGLDALFDGPDKYGSDYTRQTNQNILAQQERLVAEGLMSPQAVAANAVELEAVAKDLQNKEIDLQQTKVEAVATAAAPITGGATLTAVTLASAAVDVSQGQYSQAALNVVPGAGVDVLAKVGGKLLKPLLKAGADDAARTVASQVDDVAEGVVYRRTNRMTGEAYTGASKSEQRYLARQGEHDRALGRQHQYEIIGRAKPGTPLRVAEESAIRLGGGPAIRGGSLANKRFEMNDVAYRAAGGMIPLP